ncbi:MAG: hypothetical protein ACKVHE_06910 [Planctomycetales bacterium]|jgi:hypothetical protein
MLSSDGERLADRPDKAGRRVWWGIGVLAVVISASAGAIVFEATTGRFSGTIMQVRIDECAPRKLRMTEFRIPGPTIKLRNSDAAEDSIEVRPPVQTAPLLWFLRTRFWEKCFGPSHSFSTSFKLGSVVYYVKTGDVFQLRLGEQVTLMTWGSGPAKNTMGSYRSC